MHFSIVIRKDIQRVIHCSLLLSPAAVYAFLNMQCLGACVYLCCMHLPRETIRDER